MKTLQEIKKESEEKRTVLFHSIGLFWAFSDKQFEEGKTPLRESEKYVSIGHGGYLPKGNVNLFLDGMDLINNEEKAEIKKMKLGDAEILDALYNYECFYTGDISDAWDVLKDKYSKAKVMEIYRKNYKKAMVNN